MKFATLSLIIFFLSNISDAQNSFSAKLIIPKEIQQGEYSDITLDIYKPEGTRNYTVFTQEIPDGFFVKIVDANGANHTLDDNLLTLTWVRCPADSKISVKYQISSMAGVTGNFNLSGKLAYMVGSKQGVFNLKTYVLNVVKEKTVVINNENNNYSQNYSPLINTTLKGVSCKRAITYNKKTNVYEVGVYLKKNDAGSYSITEKIPKNFIFSELDSHNAKVRHSSDLIQFLWVNLPSAGNVKIKYRLTPKESNIEEPKIFGKLSFLKDGKILNLTITNNE
ncbi:MAG: hypothetical protein L3J35_10605 [Bacteroidales bacterium]|nr:hypothetical protein [Bacteroidales bacterium]